MSTADSLTRIQVITVRSDVDDGDPADPTTRPARAATPSQPAVVPGSPSWTLELPNEWAHAAPWRTTVHRRRLMLHDDLARLTLSGDQAAERDALVRLLDDAGVAGHTRVRLGTWWWGTQVERAWAALREVEERIVDLLPDGELTARAAGAVAHAGSYLPADDKRLLHLEALRLDAAKTPAAPVPGMRAAIVELLAAAHAAADRRNQEARFLRNRVLLASCFSVVVAAAVVLLQRWLGGDESFFALPIGSDVAPWQFVVVVMLLGVVGALFTAIPAMSTTPSDFGPFNLPLQQALLKLSFGPLVAVTGFAIANTEVLDGASPNTWPGVVLLAIVLGAGQQAVTRYVDQRAGTILDAAAPAADETTSS